MDKGFSSVDHALISFLIEFVFPILDERNQIKWLRGVIQSYHMWNGLFMNERWHRDVIKEHHNFIVKEVTRRRNLLSAIKCRDFDFVLSRKRMSDDLLWVICRLGMGERYTRLLSKILLNDDEQWEVERRLNMNAVELRGLFRSNNPRMLVHFFCVMASVFLEMKESNRIRKSVTLYSFLDIVTCKFSRCELTNT